MLAIGVASRSVKRAYFKLRTCSPRSCAGPAKRLNDLEGLTLRTLVLHVQGSPFNQSHMVPDSSLLGNKQLFSLAVALLAGTVPSPTLSRLAGPLQEGRPRTMCLLCKHLGCFVKLDVDDENVQPRHARGPLLCRVAAGQPA
jgi:hypothetical protein